MTDEEIAAANLAISFRRSCKEACGINYGGCDCRLDAIAALSAAEEIRYEVRKKNESKIPLSGS